MDKCEILNAAKDLLSDQSHWYQGGLVNGEEGIQYGTAWCAVGAISKVAGIHNYAYPDERISFGPYTGNVKHPDAAAAFAALEATCAEMFDSKTVIEVNDADDTEQAYANVMKVYDKAIANNCT